MKKIFSFIAAALVAMSMNAEAITVAQALEIAGQLAQGASTDVEYEIEGYVTAYAGADAATDGGWATYGNQIFWIADEAGTAASNADGALEIYQGVASEMVYVGDKVSVKSKLTNYNGLLETVKKAPVTILEKVERPDTPEVEEADVVFTSADFNGQGVSGTGGTVTATKNGVTFTCDKGFGDQYGVRCYKNSNVSIVSASEQIGKIVFEFATVSGTYYNGDLDEEIVVNGLEWNNTMSNQARMNKISIYFGEAEEKPKEELTPITVAEALEIAQALTPEKTKSASTTDKYAVKGFVVGISAKNENTFYLADEAGAYGEFEAYKCASVDYEVAEGDLVIVTGKIQHYWGEGQNGEYHSYEISGGTLKHVYGQGVENVVMTEKAQKVVVDGVLYIVRDGKMFNVQGAQVR